MCDTFRRCKFWIPKLTPVEEDNHYLSGIYRMEEDMVNCNVSVPAVPRHFTLLICSVPCSFVINTVVAGAGWISTCCRIMISSTNQVDFQRCLA